VGCYFLFLFSLNRLIVSCGVMVWLKCHDMMIKLCWCGVGCGFTCMHIVAYWCGVVWLSLVEC